MAHLRTDEVRLEGESVTCAALIIAAAAAYIAVVLIVARICSINGRQADAEVSESRKRRRVRVSRKGRSYSLTRGEREAIWTAAHEKTRAELKRQGLWPEGVE